MPQRLHRGDLGEEAVAADVEPVAVGDDGAAEPADDVVGLEHEARGTRPWRAGRAAVRPAGPAPITTMSSIVRRAPVTARCRERSSSERSAGPGGQGASCRASTSRRCGGGRGRSPAPGRRATMSRAGSAAASMRLSLVASHTVIASVSRPSGRSSAVAGQLLHHVDEHQQRGGGDAGPQQRAGGRRRAPRVRSAPSERAASSRLGLMPRHPRLDRRGTTGRGSGRGRRAPARARSR